MKIEITYKFTSALGFKIISNLVATSVEEAERYCKNIEELDGYDIVDVTRTE